MSIENYVYKKEVDWSLFNFGFAIPLEYQVVFKQIADRFIERGNLSRLSSFSMEKLTRLSSRTIG